jgi:hypothetical protein
MVSEHPSKPRKESISATHRLHKFLHKRLKIPQGMIQPFLSAARIALNPSQYLLRQRLAKEILADGNRRIQVPQKDGYHFFSQNDIPGIEDIVRYCTAIYQDSRRNLPPDYFQNNPKKKYFNVLLEGDEFCEHPELLRCLLSRSILDAATIYLGAVPRLSGAMLVWSPENDTARSSQLFHFDYEDLTQLKMFINIFDTTPEHGPLTFLPADVSAQVQKTVGRILGRVSDDQVYQAGGKGQDRKLVGPSGSGAFLDTSRCLHYGSRYNKKDRLILIVQFLKFHSSYRGYIPFKVPSALADFSPDLVQRLVLDSN